ncbi:type II toxin-antitoxin system MqsA family antitoxin [Candidatus Poribacteria bacterium]|nr:type II toxin-antitoxin system MqsA family antitoxin [Candidatus Poribacteria bacterium]
MKQGVVCQICGTTGFEVRHVESIYRRAGNYLIVQNVPCEVCLHCGERYYPGEVLLEIEEKFKAIHERHLAPQATVQIPVEVYAA